MGKELINGRMADFMKDYFKMIKRMVMEFWNGRMVNLIKVYLKMMKWMEKEF